MDHIKLPKIGLRTLKTALAVFICLILFPEEPFFACMTTVFCLQNTMTNSFKMAIVRGFGTFHGGVIGLTFLVFCRIINSYLADGYTKSLLTNIIITLGVITVIYTCNLFKQHASIPIACIVFFAITTVRAYDAPLYYALHRLLKTIGGLGVALLVNAFITPPKPIEKQQSA